MTELDELLKEIEQDYEAYRASVARPVGEGKPLEKVAAVHEHGRRLIAALRNERRIRNHLIDEHKRSFVDPDEAMEQYDKDTLAILRGEKP